ncbi:MAG: serine/threonine kinase [uncultured Thiotrichaceae bacterium]|uniref:Serine/threonine kinase n=1 Tax=uncultured Thiotrichaceae bacterium TaxID=298394 RepID=A0A6S6S2H3_9GAMM|nr:MAG: serine/threonine kinase [uncultured Thiotrichaceae bacterium]
MPHSSPEFSTDMTQLLEQLRLQEIRVGALELQHLFAVFQSQPVLSWLELRDLLCDVLAKDEYQRETIKRVYQRLVPYEESESARVLREDAVTTAIISSESDNIPTISKPVTEADIASKSKQATRKQRQRWKPLWTGLSALLLFTTMLIVFNWPDQPQNTQADSAISIDQHNEAHSQTIERGELRLAQHVQLWLPQIRIEGYSPWRATAPYLIVLLATGAAFIWLLYKAFRRIIIRPPKPPALAIKHGKLVLPPTVDEDDFYLLDSHARRDIAWGINRYLSAQMSSRVDIDRSVKATANSGMPEIRFLQAQKDREIWLWQDRSSENTNLHRLADELSQVLQTVNIHPRRGYFQASPVLIKDGEGQTVWSPQHETPSINPMVVVLVDSENLQLKDALAKPETHQSLNRLRHWNQLCIVDCSARPGQLCHLFKEYTLDCIKPIQLAQWMVEQGGSKAEPAICASDMLYQWAMASALPERALQESEIRSLHNALPLDCAWQYGALKRFAQVSPEGLSFSQQRLPLLNQLSEMAQKNPSLLEKAVRFWLERYHQINREAEQNPKLQWRGSLKQQRLKLDIALLQLWLPDQLKRAAFTLYRLHANKRLRPVVEQKLAKYRFTDWQQLMAAGENLPSEHDTLTLPHIWEALDADIQRKLRKAGLGGATQQQLTLSWDNASGMLMGLLAGLALSSVWGIIEYSQAPYTPEYKETNKPANALFKVGSSQATDMNPDGKKILYAGSMKHVNKRDISNAANIIIDWQQSPQFPARKRLSQNLHEDDTELWLAGELEQSPQRPANMPRLSIAVIAAPPANKEARLLAARLLDSGSADQVIVGEKWANHIRALQDKWYFIEDSQWLHFMPTAQSFPSGLSYGKHRAVIQGDLQTIARVLEQPGYYALADWSQADIYLSELHNQPILKGGIPLKLDQGMTLVPIAPGIFMMGSEDYDDEKPVHEVTISKGFYMSATEVTFAQYDAYARENKKELPSDQGWGRDNLPAINVSWHDAQNFVQWLSENNRYGLQCRLPSEAEWEYAARAGTSTAYYWGDEIGNNNANCREGLCEDSFEYTAPVASFAPNQWGLYDMSGNVLEWVQDCYHENYQQAPSDGSAQEVRCNEDRRRVLRGGSWYDVPANLRSAGRYWLDPGLRSRNVGFRLVCSLPSTER